MRLIRGEPGERWVNDTSKIVFQFHCDFKRSCARCIALHHCIGPYWPIPLHDLCSCNQSPIKPGATAEPFIDYQATLEALGPAAQRHAMGASNWRLVDSGLAKWEDVVTPGRIRDFREVVDRLDLSVDRMVKAGVRHAQAVQAYDATHSEAHKGSTAERESIIRGLKNHGVSDERIVAEVGNLLAGRFGIDGPGGSASAGSTPRNPPPSAPAAPLPKTPTPKPASPVAARPAPVAHASAPTSRSTPVVPSAKSVPSPSVSPAKASLIERSKTFLSWASRYLGFKIGKS